MKPLIETYLLLNEIPDYEKHVKLIDSEYIKKQIIEQIRDEVLIWLDGTRKIKELNIIGVKIIKPPFPSNNIRFVRPGEVVEYAINVRTNIDSLKSRRKKRRNLLAAYPCEDFFYEVKIHFARIPHIGNAIAEQNFLVEQEITDLPDKRKDELNDILEKNGYTNRIQRRKMGVSRIINLRTNWG
jgi:hypothetical protein